VRSHDNPFRTERLEALPFRFLDESWESFLARLEALGLRGAIVGPKGSGKTTLLETLARHLEGRGFRVQLIRLSASEDARRFPWSAVGPPGPRDALLVDGVEQLSTVGWLRLRVRARKAGAFVVSAHRPGRGATAARTRTTPALLVDLVAALLPSQPRPSPDDLASLFERHRGNLREALLALYDRWSTAPER
jgi:hypothetical protein